MLFLPLFCSYTVVVSPSAKVFSKCTVQQKTTMWCLLLFIISVSLRFAGYIHDGLFGCTVTRYQDDERRYQKKDGRTPRNPSNSRKLDIWSSRRLDNGFKESRVEHHPTNGHLRYATFWIKTLPLDPHKSSGD